MVSKACYVVSYLLLKLSWFPYKNFLKIKTLVPKGKSIKERLLHFLASNFFLFCNVLELIINE